MLICHLNINKTYLHTHLLCEPPKETALVVALRPSVRLSVRLSIRLSVQCLRFSRNKKSAETSNLVTTYHCNYPESRMCQRPPGGAFAYCITDCVLALDVDAAWTMSLREFTGSSCLLHCPASSTTLWLSVASSLDRCLSDVTRLRYVLYNTKCNCKGYGICYVGYTGYTMLYDEPDVCIMV